jgi:hypothetical protein
VITHGFPQKPSVFSLRSIYLSSYSLFTCATGPWDFAEKSTGIFKLKVII